MNWGDFISFSGWEFLGNLIIMVFKASLIRLEREKVNLEDWGEKLGDDEIFLNFFSISSQKKLLEEWEPKSTRLFEGTYYCTRDSF